MALCNFKIGFKYKNRFMGSVLKKKTCGIYVILLGNKSEYILDIFNNSSEPLGNYSGKHHFSQSLHHIDFICSSF